jgi:hypothetical protein
MEALASRQFCKGALQLGCNVSCMCSSPIKVKQKLIPASDKTRSSYVPRVHTYRLDWTIEMYALGYPDMIVSTYAFEVHTYFLPAS